MKILRITSCLGLFLWAHVSLLCAESAPEELSWTLQGVGRTALVYAPAKTTPSAPCPLVFGFHGHGGSSRQAARSFQLHTHWPEALVVYMQGLPTPGILTDPEGRRNGWQHKVGEQGDRDLLFFDQVLKTLQEKYPVDARRIHVTGHSNGAAFCGVLWQARPEIIASAAPSAGGGATILKCTPKPVFYLAGEKDPLVKLQGQQRVIQAARALNGCSGASGVPWMERGLRYASEEGFPVYTWIHDGTHRYRPEAPAMIIQFFKENPAPAREGAKAE